MHQRTRSLVAGVLLVVIGLVLPFGSSFPDVVLFPVAGLVFLAGAANLAVVAGRPAVARERWPTIEALSFFAFAFVAAVIAVGFVRPPRTAQSFVFAGVFLLIAAYNGWFGVVRLRSPAENPWTNQ